VKPLFALALAASVAGCASASARPAAAPQQRTAVTPPAGAPAAAAAPGARPQAGPFKPFAEVTRDATRREGWFDTYEKGDALYLAIPSDRLGKDFLISYQIAEGVGAAGLFSGTMLNIFEGSVVALERRGDRVMLLRKPVRFTAPENTPAATAVELTFSPSVLESAKIESIREDGTLLVNIYDWVVSDLSGVGERVRFAAAPPSPVPNPNPPPVPLAKERSFLQSVKAFPTNVNIRATLTFRPSTAAQLNSVPDGRYIPVTVAYTLAPLPETPMTPREADDRMGYFITARKDFSTYEDNFFRRMINRWRLEPGEPAEGGLMTPRKPIVYYLDPNIPVEYRPAFKAAVEAWNPAFEAAGWKNAIRAEMLPEGADAEDMRYPTIRWNVSDQAGYGAIGPSIVDPRTGEILDADILIEANMVAGYRREFRTMVTPAAAIEEVLGLTDGGGERAALAAELSAQATLMRTLLVEAGVIGPNDPIPAAHVNEGLKWVMMHEVGHTLGLRHNFRSSFDTPLDKLGDRQWAERNGVFSSVMEYPSVNVPEKGKPFGYMYNPGVGSSDRWVISYGYVADANRARQIARQAAQAGHAFGTDEDASGPGALDPTVTPFDLGQDPLAWAQGRAELLRGMWPKLPSYVLTDNARYGELTDAFNNLMGQYARTLGVGVKYIGGQYVNRDRVGDPSGRAPFVAIPREKQREALRFVTEYGFSERAFDIPQEVLVNFGSNRWSHWGQPNTYNGRIDYPLTELVIGAQTSLLNQITSPWTFSKIRDAEMKFGSAGTLPIPELMSELTRAVWSEAYSGGGRSITGMRRELQRAYLERMTDLVARRTARMPGDARAAARAQLVELRGRLASASGGDAMTRAHLAESRSRIDKALEAGLDVELGQ
jgi:hypothetical protein